MSGRGGHTPEVKGRKLGPPSDSEDLEPLNKRLRNTSNFREWWKAMEYQKRLAQFDDEKGGEDASFDKRMRLSMYYPSENSLPNNQERGIWLHRMTTYPNPSSRSYELHRGIWKTTRNTE